jgi:hypothetical protein
VNTVNSKGTERMSRAAPLLMLSYDSAATQPLTTDALIHERATALVGRAVRRQLWLLFLDEHDLQLPVIMPIDDLPVSPPDGAKLPIAAIAQEVGARSVVVVLERYGDDTLTENDKEWARHLRESCAATSVRLRAILLSHRRGVRWVAVDDLL